jgi:hypothetical protein
MNPFELVLGIIVVVTIGSVLRARYGNRQGPGGTDDLGADQAAAIEAARLRDEVRALRERVQVLERVITDNEASSLRLDREIEALRDPK